MCESDGANGPGADNHEANGHGYTLSPSHRAQCTQCIVWTTGGGSGN